MSEHPLQDTTVKLDTYRAPREGTVFGTSDEEVQIDFHMETTGRYDRDKISRTLASVVEKDVIPSEDVLRVRNITARTKGVMRARVDGMHISDRPFLKEVA